MKDLSNYIITVVVCLTLAALITTAGVLAVSLAVGEFNTVECE